MKNVILYILSNVIFCTFTRNYKTRSHPRIKILQYVCVFLGSNVRCYCKRRFNIPSHFSNIVCHYETDEIFSYPRSLILSVGICIILINFNEGMNLLIGFNFDSFQPVSEQSVSERWSLRSECRQLFLYLFD